MPKILNQKLYNQVKEEANKIYKKSSAYKSGYIVKEYKRRGGKYEDDNKPKNLKRWFKEDWKDIGYQNYPVYRPTKKVSFKTPLTINEIEPSNLLYQIKEKQKIKGNYNLKSFIKK